MLELRIPLSEGTAAYTESVTVTADRFQRPELVPAQQILGSAELQSLRGVLTDDALRAVQVLPGVATGDDFLIFNLSRSEGFALCATTVAGQVGVDIERLRPVDDEDAIVHRYFAPGEMRQYESVRSPERTAAFFSTWTRKEAFVKAVGSGLQRELSSFEVEGSPDAVCPRLTLEPEDHQARWSLRSFSPRPQYVAAVALDRDIEALEFFDWSIDALATIASNPFALH